MRKTPLYEQHKALGARFVNFGDWEMPIHYSLGIIEEHLATRKYGGLFDVSHMGRFLIKGKSALPLLQYYLTNNAAALEPGQAQYTIIPNESGGAVDDGYLYRLNKDEYLLVVNAVNIEKDWEWLQKQQSKFPDAHIENKTAEIAMLAFQGRNTKSVLEEILRQNGSALPPPGRNNLKTAEIDGVRVYISRTGYTGEPISFELFVPAENAETIWKKLLAVGAKSGIIPVGLGARDTLRLEAGMPLYGHELGTDIEGNEIPIYAIPQAVFAVSFSAVKGEFIGRTALKEQFEELKLQRKKKRVPKRIYPIAVTGEGIARQGYEIYIDKTKIGYVTSGTVVPFWKFDGVGIEQRITEEKGRRAICLGYINADIEKHQEVLISSRNKFFKACSVERNLGSEAPPYARPILVEESAIMKYTGPRESVYSATEKVSAEIPHQNLMLQSIGTITSALIKKTVDNTVWRQRSCINLIPSEQTPSRLVRLLTIADSSGRYAEHRVVKALGRKEVYYYQGTNFIEGIEEELAKQMKSFLECAQVETRAVSGQMANTAVFSGMVRYLNRLDRKSEPARLRKVMNYHICNGGHLSAQPMGALRDYIAIDPKTDKPAVVNFPVLDDNPYKIDIQKTAELIEKHEPVLIILGKSVILHPDPVMEIRKIADKLSERSIIMYDMAHVFGLVGEHFQRPFKEGADIVTGSTHKTFFGPQRGIIAADMDESSENYNLWETIVRRTFPGSVSNHHLGTQLAILMACYEMNAFGKEYQKQVIANAKAFALALNGRGLHVEGDPAVNYTETHQVVIRVGYAKGIDAARKLEKNNIVVNYQGAPDDEGFTSSSCLRLGVQEMTRFGMKEKDFNEVANLIADVILHEKDVSDKVSVFRKKFTEMQYCLPEEVGNPLINELVEKIV